MKLVVQRVKKAKVLRRVQDYNSWEKVGEIKKGLFVLVGFKRRDTKETVELLAVKLSKLRVMSDGEDKRSLASQSPGKRSLASQSPGKRSLASQSPGKMNLSVTDVGGKILVVSQFTLHADTSGGNRPSFINAEDPEKARKLYEFFIEKLKGLGIPVETGSFGDYMEIDALLDGPVTIIYSD